VSAALLDWGCPTLVAILAQAGAISLLLIVASIWFLRSPGRAGRWRVALYILPIGVAAVPPGRRLQRRLIARRISPDWRRRGSGKRILGPPCSLPQTPFRVPQSPRCWRSRSCPPPANKILIRPQNRCWQDR